MVEAPPDYFELPKPKTYQLKTSGLLCLVFTTILDTQLGGTYLCEMIDKLF